MSWEFPIGTGPPPKASQVLRLGKEVLPASWNAAASYPYRQADDIFMSIVRNALPGEDGETHWFARLNAFEQAETIRQVQFKRKHWPELRDGCWSKDPSRTYPHILPDGELEKAYFGPIAADVLRYCADNDIAIHSEALNLRSSQVCCFNVLFPLRDDHQLGGEVLADVLPGVTQVTDIEFEWTGPDRTTEWLGEPAGGQRGQNRTSIDAAIWWQQGERSMLTLCEWKYTERSYGTCGGFVSKGNRTREHCLSHLPHVPDYRTGCYLTQGRNHRRYWERLDELGFNLEALVDGSGCPLRGPFYQLARQFLLAGHVQEETPGLGVQVASLSFRGNSALHATTAGSRTVEEAWSAALGRGKQSLRVVPVEDVVAGARQAAAPSHSAWLAYLAGRYGL